MIGRPTRDQLLAAHGKALKPVIAPGLSVLFCGINPSLYSAAVGHHFAGPSNRFWKVLHQAGFTPRLLGYAEDETLLAVGCGVTNLVNFATTRADELSPDQLIAGGRRLTREIGRYQPRVVAVVGMGAFRAAFGQPRAALGEQPARVGESRLWVLPNPSGLNANYQLPDLVRLYGEAREAAGLSRAAAAVAAEAPGGDVSPKPRRRRGTT